MIGSQQLQYEEIPCKKKKLSKRHHDEPGEERHMNGSPTTSAFYATISNPTNLANVHEFFNSYELVSTCHFPSVHLKQTLRTDL